MKPKLSTLLLALALCLSAAGCERSAKSLYADGQDAYRAKDFAKALTLYERACNGGEMRACTSLGAMAFSGEGGRRDVSWARGLYEKACKGGDTEGCMKLRALTAAGPQAANTTPPAPTAEPATEPVVQPATEATATAETAPIPAEPTVQPSFDCATAHHRAERLICSDSDLAKRDVDLDRLYRHARRHAADEEAVIVEQRDWVALRRNACVTKECLREVYADRAAELEDWIVR